MKKFLGFIFALVFVLFANFAQATNWTFVDLHPAGFGQSWIMAVFAGQQFGFADDPNSMRQASRWQGVPGSWSSLGPGNIIATDGSTHVGFSTQNGQTKAASWFNGGVTFLTMPVGATSSMAFGMSGIITIGSFTDANGRNHAILWGKRGSFVDLHPQGFAGSQAFAAGNSVQAGQICPVSDCHAAIWHNTAASMIDAHPSGYQSSFIRAIQGDFGVGSATLTSGQSHAGYWNMTNGGFADVHNALIPALNSSALNAWNNNWAVGNITFFNNDPLHAGFFNFNTGEFQDLHAFLTPGQYTMSNAFAIWHPTTGTTFVGGVAQNAADGQFHAILWIQQ